MSKTIQASDLIASVASILIASGSSEQEAHTVASNLVMANLSGHDSHGVGMLPRYVAAVLEGGLKPNTSVKTLLDLGHMLTLDGQRGYGQVIGEQTMQMGIERAKQHGSCIMTLSNSHHLGRIGHWAEMATSAGLVSMHFVNVMARPAVAPWGGADGRFGTNPCCIGIPLAGREPFLLDFATSRVAQGKMRVAYNEGHTVAPGLLIDETGAPTVNPGVVVVPQSNGLFGALMTFGEHKGYGMAVACELLGGALTGGGSWHEPANSPRGKAQAVLNGMLTVLIDPAKLGTQASFESEAQAFVDWVKQSPAGQDSESNSEFEGVQIAGDPERRARIQRGKDGIVIDDQTWADIVAAGVKVGVSVK
jgi:hydroxycarboxylate dehydrogenase B